MYNVFLNFNFKKKIIILKFSFLNNLIISLPPYTVGTSLYDIILTR